MLESKTNMRPRQQVGAVPSPSIESTPSGASSRLILVLAIACAFSVANLYYNQPLLAQMARDLNVRPQAQIVLIVTLSQVGYATGLLCLVPLGDLVERRRLILLTLCGVTVALLATAQAPSLSALAFLSFAIGVTTVVPQMLIPFGVHLSPPHARGRTVGTIMSGLLLGILLSRTVAGVVSAHLGWRAVYLIASGLMVALAIVLRLLLPRSENEQRLTYPELLRSLVALVREQPLLREAALSGALLFGTFSAFWATLSLLLSGPPFRYGPEGAGMFGLVGAVGALAAGIIGRLADRFSARTLIGGSALLVLLSYGIFALSRHSLVGLIIGVILLDLGVQAAQVTNQTRVYNLVPGASSRLNTVYMTMYFVGGSCGSWLAARGWSQGGWNGVCLVGAALAALAMALNIVAAKAQGRQAG